MLVKMGSSSPNRGGNKKYLKPPPSLRMQPQLQKHEKELMMDMVVVQH